MLAPYALSAAYLERLRAQIGGDVRAYSVGELRRLGARGLVATLRKERGGECLIALEDDSGRPLVPVLGTLAVVAGASRIDVIDTRLARQPLSRGRALAALGSVAAASVHGAMTLRSARRTVEQLAGAERQIVQPAGDKRMLYLNAQLWYGVTAGGSVAHIAGVVNALCGFGYDVTYASLAEPVLLDERVEVVRLGSPTSFGLPPEINYIRLQPRVADETLALARRQDPAFLYQRLAVASYAGPMIARELRVPYVLEYNGSEVWIARNWGRPLRYDAFAAAAETASLRHAHLVVTVSGVLRDELVEHGVEPERIVMHPNGVDPQTFDPAAFEPSELATLRDRLGLPRDAFVVGFIGTFGEWHGADVLARAIRRLAEHNRAWLDRRPVRFLLVGDGFRMPEVRAILGDLVGDVAVLPGLVPQREAPAHLAATDLLVSPHVPNRDDTRFFGSPTKLFEYMAIARPIVASDLEQLGEVLRPALHVPALPTGEPAPNAPEVAVLARPGDVDELVAGIRFLVENPAWAARLGANARARVLGHYTWRHHVAAILERLAQRPS